jgi:hypothetical protein
MTNDERKNIWNRIGWILRQAARLEKQVQDARPYWETCSAAEKYQTETTKGNIELFDLMDRLLADSNYRKGKRQ